MTFIPVPRKANYTGDEGYHPNSLMSFMQKTMKKLVTRNVRGPSKGHVPYIYINLPTNQGTPQKLKRTRWIHLYRKKWKIGSYSWAFLDIEENSDSTSHDITKVSNCHEIQDTLAISWLYAEWQKNYSHSQVNKWRVCGLVLCAEGYFISL
jgi:hypothetical protein